ncbi:MAG: hypothetical protein JST82_03175 [Bacteroidetes bacterium]|nr:hypothetical protein [Bacteroidota bacterium]
MLSATKGYSQYSFKDYVSGNIDVYTVMNISFTNLAGVVSFNTPDDYNSGQTLTNAAAIAVKSNALWVITISAQSQYFQAMSGGASTTMPASIAGFRLNGNTSWIQLSTNSQTLKTGSRGNTTVSGNTFNIDMNINPGFSYSGGIYNIGVLYTISQQ